MENSAVTSAEALALSEELLSIGQENSLKRFYSIGEKSILENETWYEKEKQIWESVRVLSQEARKSEEQLDAECKEESQRQLDAAAQKLQQAESRLQEVKAETQRAREHKIKVDGEHQTIKDQMACSVDQGTKDLLLLKEQVKLYSNVSGIRWQYDCPEEEIKGYVCNNGTVKPVSFHQNHNSKLFIANAIWDQMEPDW